MNKNSIAGPLSFKLVLPAAAVILGSIAGVTGYLIGQYFYVVFLFPFILLTIAAILYFPILKFFRAQSVFYNALCGLLLGLATFFMFHYTGYHVYLFETARSIQVTQHIDQQSAVNSVTGFIKSATGLDGFIGFMKFQANQHQAFIYYITNQRNVITRTFHVVLLGKRTYLYWAGEAAVILGGSFLLGLLAGGNPLKKKTAPQSSAT